jgi:FKBP-type peptidyl-prolyl cis-trans isomerase (trigger factor)
MMFDRMDTAAAKVRRSLTVVSLLETGGDQVTREQINEALAMLREQLQDAGTALEEAYIAAQQKPGQAPALMQCSAAVTCLRRPA